MLSTNRTRALGIGIVLRVYSLVLLGAFLLRRHMTATTAYFLLRIYLGWMRFVFYDMVKATRGAG
uniref:Uncharacterized protein n=1 Tax=Candidatus Kentrum sp. SD TaxID=2126332 RepID=A0A450YK85_9GAMM|nr:MAG: hypothetical protein BECKSD772F_GA0070984_110912 [Candidatus Kentron sp. SD]VFK78883.1 MAG: hypothetical protein BECKSD772D_GA0070982_102822 [Candidatus Kentron sp. SD]